MIELVDMTPQNDGSKSVLVDRQTKIDDQVRAIELLRTMLHDMDKRASDAAVQLSRINVATAVEDAFNKLAKTKREAIVLHFHETQGKSDVHEVYRAIISMSEEQYEEMDDNLKKSIGAWFYGIDKRIEKYCTRAMKGVKDL